MDNFKFHKEYKHSGHGMFIYFFNRTRFGANNPIMTYFSVLAPVDSCVILEELYNPNILDSIINDKLLLAYVKNGKQALAQKVIENSIRNGENDLNIYGIKSKLDIGLPAPMSREQRITVYKDFFIKNSKFY